MNPHRPPAGARAVAATTAALWLLSAAVPAAVEALAHGRRVALTPVPVTGGGLTPVMAADGRAVLEEWLRRGVVGRTVLHVGAYLHSVPPEGIARTVAPLQATAGETAALRDAIRRAAGDRSYLWAAVELGVARRVVFIEPRQRLAARAGELGLPAPRAGEALDLGICGLERVAYESVPPMGEPVLLDVAASWFEDGDPRLLRAELAAAGVRADVVTLNRLGGTAEVSEPMRDRLSAFGASLSRADAMGTPR